MSSWIFRRIQSSLSGIMYYYLGKMGKPSSGKYSLYSGHSSASISLCLLGRNSKKEFPASLAVCVWSARPRLAGNSRLVISAQQGCVVILYCSSGSFMVPRFLLNEGVRKTGVCSKFYPKVTVPGKRGNFSPLLSHKTVKMVNFILSAFYN